MQIMIDTLMESAVGLRRAARLLKELADEIEQETIDPQALALVDKLAPVPSNVVDIASRHPIQVGDQGAPPAPAPRGPLDDAGTPWDARIHSEKKSKTQKGTWRVRKFLGAGVLETVMAELKGSAAATAVPLPVGIPAPPAPDADTLLVPPPSGIPVAGNSAVPLANASAGTLSAPAAPAVGALPETAVLPGGPMSFRQFMAKVQPLINSGRLTNDQLTLACVSNGVANIPALIPQPLLYAGVMATIEGMANPA